VNQFFVKKTEHIAPGKFNARGSIRPVFDINKDFGENGRTLLENSLSGFALVHKREDVSAFLADFIFQIFEQGANISVHSRSLLKSFWFGGLAPKKNEFVCKLTQGKLFVKSMKKAAHLSSGYFFIWFIVDFQS
jgi:hypothetical protein